MLPLKDSFVELQGTVLNASMYFDAWWELKNAANPAHAQYQKTIRRYFLFFNAAADAQLIAIVILLYQCFETRKDTQNFGALLARLEKEDTNAQALVSSIRGTMKELQPVWRKIAKMRSTVMAHLSHAATSEDLMAAADITPDEIAALISGSKKLIAPLDNYFGILGTPALNPNVKAHVKKLMKDLEKRKN